MLSVVKHNPNGKMIHKAVFDCDIDGAIALLDGKGAVSETFGSVGVYDTRMLEKWGGGNFRIQNIYGIRHFFGLQRNEVKSQADWADNMFELENRSAVIPSFREIAYFHHIVLRRSDLV